jgi:hypothetical protein
VHTVFQIYAKRKALKMCVIAEQYTGRAAYFFQDADKKGDRDIP